MNTFRFLYENLDFITVEMEKKYEHLAYILQVNHTKDICLLVLEVCTLFINQQHNIDFQHRRQFQMVFMKYL